MFSPYIKQKLKLWRHSSLAFVKEAIRANPSEQQVEALVAFDKTNRLTIRSGHGTGKDALASWLALKFLSMHVGLLGSTVLYPKVVCTAPTGRQLNDVLWSEISRWLRQSVFADEFVIQSDKIFGKEAPKEWWIRAVSASVKSTKEEQAETLAGFHAEHLFFIVDESSGVPDPVFIPLEGAMTQEDNKILLIGNMTRNSGYFYDSHFHSEISKAWLKLHWDSRKSPVVKGNFCEYMLGKYGEESDVFRIRVAGDPPSGDSRTLIPLAWAEQCIGNEISVPENEPVYLGLDVARYGEDASIALPRQGNLIMPWDEYHGMNIITLAAQAKQTYIEMEAEGMAIDEIGIGAGVVDWLEKHNLPGLFGVNVASASSDKKKADRLRDELWIRVRTKCMRLQYSFPTIKKPEATLNMGQELANELATPNYDFNKDGGYIVESKKKMKARGKSSPNIADALCLSEYFQGVATKVWPKKRMERDRSRSYIMYPVKNAWMQV